MTRNITVLLLVYVTVFAAISQCDGAVLSNNDAISNQIAVTSRTFGPHALRRLSFIFLPVMFTLGVISTLLMALAVISIKNLAIGVILLIVAISQAVSRLFSAATAPPLLLQPRAEYVPTPAIAAPWPAAGPLLSPWARSDIDSSISE